MKFKFAFEVHSDIFATGTRYVCRMPGIVTVMVDKYTLAFLFEYKDGQPWKYCPTDVLVNGWNSVSLDGDGSYITLTINTHHFLLLDGTIYRIATEFSNFDTNNFVVINNTSSIGAADNWEQQWHIVTDANASDTSSSRPHHSQYINSGNTANYCDFGIQWGYWNMFLSSNGSNWNIVNGAGRNVRVQNSTEYLVNLAFTGSQYIFKGSTDLGQNWTTFDTYNSTTKLYTVPSTRLGNSYDRSWPWQGNMYIDEYCFIKTNGEYIFNGKTAVSGTDYENQGCTAEITRIYEDPYPLIKTGELKTYQSWLYLKNIQALKLED